MSDAAWEAMLDDLTPSWWEALNLVECERMAQVEKWGTQSMPDGTSTTYAFQRDAMRNTTDRAMANGTCTWRHVLAEEFFEALAEVDPEKLRVELVQVAAVCVAWIEDLDRKRAAIAAESTPIHDRLAAERKFPLWVGGYSGSGEWYLIGWLAGPLEVELSELDGATATFDIAQTVTFDLEVPLD